MCPPLGHGTNTNFEVHIIIVHTHGFTNERPQKHEGARPASNSARNQSPSTVSESSPVPNLVENYAQFCINESIAQYDCVALLTSASYPTFWHIRATCLTFLCCVTTIRWQYHGFKRLYPIDSYSSDNFFMTRVRCASSLNDTWSCPVQVRTENWQFPR